MSYHELIMSQTGMQTLTFFAKCMQIAQSELPHCMYQIIIADSQHTKMLKQQRFTAQIR